MKRIDIYCKGCGSITTVKREEYAPKTAKSMGCNWCPECEDKANEYYNEWYVFKKRKTNQIPKK